MPTLRDSRTTRYMDLLPIERLQTTTCTIVGVGAIGRAVTIQLASMDVRSLTLIDPDTVGEENLGPQGYPPCDVGQLKVTSLGEHLRCVNPECTPIMCNRFYDGDTDQIVFCCVDSMEARNDVFSCATDSLDCELLIEARMAAETFQIRTVPTALPNYREAWKKDWFPDSEAVQIPCTARSTIYNAHAAAAFMVARLAEFIRDTTPPYLSTCNMLNGTASSH